MTMTPEEYESVQSYCYNTLSEPSLDMEAGRRGKLAGWVTTAMDAEFGKHLGAEVPHSSARLAMHRAIHDRVMQMNQDEGFVFITIILGAILSWLIQRLLDHFFPKSM